MFTSINYIKSGRSVTDLPDLSINYIKSGRSVTDLPDLSM